MIASAALAEQPVPEPAVGEVASSAGPPAWPVTVLIWGTPLWWAAGLFSFAPIIMAVPMVAFLLVYERRRTVPGVLPWFAFVVWTLPSVLVAGISLGLLGYGLRLAQFVAFGILLQYVVRCRALTVRRTLLALVAMWVSIIACGYLAMLFPEVRLTFTVGRLLPGKVTDNEYVRDLVFPPLAEVQLPYGATTPFLRPAAPFPYANGWGAAMALLTPAVVAAALFSGRRRALVWLVVGLAAFVPPAVATTNRGLFLTLAFVVVYVLVRMAGRGRLLGVAALGLAVASLVGLLASAGLFAKIADRQGAADTTQGRSELYVETLHRTLGSPVVGFGTPQPSATSEITVGTQGMLFNVMFCFGFVGLALFLFFLVGAVVRTWGAPTSPALWLHAVVVGSVLMSVFYGMDRQMVPLMAVIGLLLRERGRPGSPLWHEPRLPEPGA